MLDDRGHAFYFWQGQETLLCSTASEPFLRPAKFSVQGVTGVPLWESIIPGL